MGSVFISLHTIVCEKAQILSPDHSSERTITLLDQDYRSSLVSICFFIVYIFTQALALASSPCVCNQFKFPFDRVPSTGKCVFNSFSACVRAFGGGVGQSNVVFCNFFGTNWPDPDFRMKNKK